MVQKQVRPAGNSDAGLYIILAIGGILGALGLIGLGLARLRGDVIEPGIGNLVAYIGGNLGLILAILAVLCGGVGWLWWRVWDRGRPERLKRQYRQLAGMGGPKDVLPVASAKAVVKAGKSLRPSLDKPQVTDVGYLEGKCYGYSLYSKVEDSIFVIGPPRSGKGYFIVINRILNAPGAVITTSTRPDNLAVTMRERAKGGRPVVVFDPEGMAPGIDAGMKWSPVRGCEDADTAAVRGAGLAASGFSASGENKMWQDLAASALRNLLHAAAIEGLGARELYSWSLSPIAAQSAVEILTQNPRAIPGWGEDLSQAINSDPRQRDSIWLGVRQALGSLANPRVLEAVSPRPGEGLDPADLLRRQGTLYMIGTAQGAVASAGLITALVEDIVQTAKKMAAASPGARLDPPLALILDEAANYPLPSLGQLMSEGGGSGISTTAVVQSLAQAREKWGADMAQAIWDSATVKHVLGGSANPETLRDISALIGERDEITLSSSQNGNGGLFGGRSLSESVRRVPIMSADLVRQIPFGMGLLMLRSAPPVMVDHLPWTARKEAPALEESRNQIEKTIQEAFAYANR